jgi:predicted nucleic acid-binding protein
MILCLDANCIIYLIEKNPIWGPKVTARLAAARAAGDQLAACDLARAECLVGPLAKGDALLLADYQRFFPSPTVQMLPVTAAVCERTARVRIASAMQFKLPDALHLAAAIEHGCGLFLTNDAQLAPCTDITVEVLT